MILEVRVMKKYLLKSKWWALGYIVFSLAVSGMSVYLSIIIRDIVDTAIGLDLDGFWGLITTSAIFFVAFGVIYYLAETTYAMYVARMIRHVREDVFAGIIRQDMSDFEAVNSADYISALTNDTKLLEENYLLPLASVIQMGMMLIIAVGFMFYLSWIVSVSLLVTLILLVGVQTLFGAPIKKRQTRQSETLSVFTVKLKDIFSGFEVIKSYQMHNRARENFNQGNNDAVKANFSMYHMSSILGAVSSVVGLFLQVGVVFFSAYLIIGGQLSPGSMVGLLIVAGQITGPVQALGAMIPMISGSKEIRDRLEDFANRQSSIGGTMEAKFSTDIRVDNLAFTYPDAETPALNGIDVYLEKNKKYVLVRKSGCGKTTLAKALMGHLTGYSGEVMYDGVNLSEFSRESFDTIPTIVHQNVYMFDEDIEKNISLHKPYTTDELRQAVDASGVSLFLSEERTLQTDVGENGANLSGGQRQRIAVARALIQNKPLLILDEGTSAVDMQTGADIEHRLLAREELTLVTITHSLDAAMLRQYDAIIYMEAGHIIDQGSYADLMASGGAFSQYMHPE